MDTTWFAIDSDGHVAAFNSGEAGAVPLDAFVDEHELGPLHEALYELPRTEARLDPAGAVAGATLGHEHITEDQLAKLRPAPPPSSTTTRADAPAYSDEVLMFLRELPADTLAKLGARELPATTGFCIVATSFDLDTFRSLHERGLCTRCEVTYRTFGTAQDGDDTPEIAAYGIFDYDHTCENWMSGPYARRAVPSTPLHVDQLPASAREHLVTFAGRFADTVELQPAEHWPCESWQSGWLASDRKTVRPFAGHEADYKASIAEMREHEPDLVFKEPAATSTTAGARTKKWWQFWK